VEGEVAIGGAESCNEVVLPGADGAFCGVAAVNVGGNELKVNVLFGHVGFEGFGGFVVEFLELRFEAA
jgi:hypothetical protein